MSDDPIQQRITSWLEGPYDEETKAEIRSLMASNPASLKEAFASELSFGTGGMRNLMGVGTDRINRYTIRAATQGLANYILKQETQNPSAFVGFDGRLHSSQFAEDAACVLAANGIRVYLLKELRPTPFISFGCREKKCQAAIMITASHNPKEYNGYKVYWADGAQVVPPHDIGILKEVKAISSPSQVNVVPLEHPLIERVGAPLDLAYIEAIRPLQRSPHENKKQGSSLKIAFTSLHGTGITLAPAALKDWGFTTLDFVKQQITPDPAFSTIKYPNPEYADSLKLGIELLKQNNNDLLLATDADADRLGVVAMHKGAPVILTGNEIASLCVDYLCQADQERGPSPKGAFITTIVSTELIKTISETYKKATFEVLTGFKYIGEMIHLWETSKDSPHFLFGAEESYGFLLGTHSRDKDAIVSSCLIAEIASSAKQKGQTLIDLLEEIYRKYGVFREKQHSLAFPPTQEGMQKMKELMQELRKQLPKTLCGQQVIIIEDYQSGLRHQLEENRQEKLTLPTSDVLLFRLADKSKLVIRPSGTEPKLKIYAAVRGKMEKGISESDRRLDALLAALLSDLTPPHHHH